MTNQFDLSEVRKEFPVTKRMLYLDSAHQTPLSNCVRAALNEFYSEGLETAGPKPVWLRRVEDIREQVAKLLNASASEIAFTKNTSEGLNIAANAVPLVPGDNVLMIEGDHPNNAYAWLNLKRKGVEVRFINLTTEVAIAETFAPYIDARTKVISLSHVTFHAGHRHDVESIGALCKAQGIYLVVDAMQSVGVLPVDVKKLGVSVLAAGCHKGLLVPQGLGILYVQDGLDALQPAYLAMAGLANPPADYIARPDDLALRKDAGRFELGNFNLPNLHALNAALDLINSVGVDAIEEHVLSLGDRLIAHLDELGVRLVGPRTHRNRAHIYVLDLPVDEWMEYFTRKQVRVSPERDGIRISFALFNTFADVDSVADLIRQRLKEKQAPLAAQAI
ncbi:aminotransferase class V-fold PLP-dependent enzyme [Ralstonia solanacearum]|uniref:aminotransferase class V-fold PLP-dependent enzyme n=1 Tax=Ralstonia solanacearum TaxID=305 RepID=UPI0018D1B08D|nr:aminotransferase class V-fold PLP-dependent enzyme [Ralstonia solanacearum]